MHYLNFSRTLFTYQSRGGEAAFGRCEIRTAKPEVSGFSAAITQREIIEAVFVLTEWAGLARSIIELGAEEFGIAAMLDAHAIPYCYPTGTATAAVVSFPDRSDNQPAHQVA